jgi:hypothetical protein
MLLGRKATTICVELENLGWSESTRTTEIASYLSTLLMNLANGFDSVQVVDTRIDTNLVQHGDASILCLLLEFTNGRRYIACGDDVCSAFDSRPNDSRMVDKWDEGDNEVVFGDATIKLR